MASFSSNPSQGKYDVFLSFRGTDTRDGFVSHLFDACLRKQIITFKDENLDRGEVISSALLQTIEESHVSVVIFSKNYAYSPWCLDELVKILYCKKVTGQVILPVFYEIDPTEVQELTGSYGDALKQHKEKFKDCLVESWSRALREIAGMSGFVSWNIKPETKLIEDITNHISERLNQTFSNDHSPDGLVGIDSCIKDIESLLNIESPDVGILGIWGMGGIGKTTIASKVFNRISSQFDRQCFVANVREKLEKCTLDGLQHEILSKLSGKEISNIGMPIMLSSSTKNWVSRKKVLIVLDDVSDLDQLEYLIGAHAIYDAPGSRIIVTSRDKQILQNLGAKVYEVQKLRDNQALQLFLFHALKQNPPTKAYVNLAKKAVKHAQGNPLAVKVFGSNLYNKSVAEWESELEKLKGVSDKKIEKILKLSFDELDDNEQRIFLDIACFFNFCVKDHVESVLDGCDFFARIGISRLLDKSLLTISDRRLVMHDLLKQMGHDIIRKQGRHPGERSRLWIAQDIYHVLRKEKGTVLVEGISLDVTKIKDIELSCTTFSKMSSLRLLEFYSPFYPKDVPYINDTSYHHRYLPHNIYKSRNGVRLPKAELSFLSDELRYLYWFQYPGKSLPFNFCSENLVQLHLINSQVEELRFEHQSLENLKVMDLRFSVDLIKIPDLSELPKLEVLCLRCCSSLVEIRSSIRYQSKLSHLDLENCKSLCIFPRFSDLRNLEFLCLEGCSGIREFPEVAENIRQIILNGTAIQQVPSSIGHRSLLTRLELKSCTVLKSLPSSIGELRCLECLDLKGCFELMILPDDICNLKSLISLDVSKCLNLNGLPENLGNLKSLNYLYLSRSGVKKLPSSINNLGKLQDLHCDGCKGLILPPFTDGLSHLSWVSLNDCSLLEIPESIGSLTSLTELSLGGNDMEMLPTVIKQLTELRGLNLSDCKRLKCLPELPSALQDLHVRHCTSLKLMSTSLAKGNSELLWLFDAGNCLNLGQKELRNIIDGLPLRFETMLPLLRRESIWKSQMDEYSEYNVVTFNFRSCIVGYDVPQILKYQNNSGSSLQVPLSWDGYHVVALAFCAVVEFNGYHSSNCFFVRCEFSFLAECGSDITFHSRYPDECEKNSSEESFLWLSAVQLTNSEYRFSEASFEFYADCEKDRSSSIRVIKCGVHLLCDDDH